MSRSRLASRRKLIATSREAFATGSRPLCLRLVFLDCAADSIFVDSAASAAQGAASPLSAAVGVLLAGALQGAQNLTLHPQHPVSIEVALRGPEGWPEEPVTVGRVRKPPVPDVEPVHDAEAEAPET